MLLLFNGFVCLVRDVLCDAVWFVFLRVTNMRGSLMVPYVKLYVFACLVRRYVFVCSVYDVSCGVV